MSMIRRWFVAVTIALVAAGPLAGQPPILHAAPLLVAAPAQAPEASDTALTALLSGLAVFGAIRIKDTASLAKKFVTRAGAAGGDYKDGVAQAGQDWETNTKAAEDVYKTAVVEAANQGRYGRGVAAAGGAKFVTQATTLGAQRYAPGVQAAEGAWARGTQPYLDSLKGVELGPKRPRGQNSHRANAVADRLHQERVSRLKA